MGWCYVQTGGNAANSGSRNLATAAHSGSACTAVGAVITLDTTDDLSGINATAGSLTQDSINIAGATNANRTIFWIVAVDNVLKTVTVDVAPSGLTTNAWKIGGHYLWPSGAGVNVVEGALGVNGAADHLRFLDTPASKTVTFLTTRIAGTSAIGGPTVDVADGTRPVFNVTNTAAVIDADTNGALWSFEGFEVDQDGASGAAILLLGGQRVKNIKVSDAGGLGINVPSSGTFVGACEVTGTGAGGIAISPGGLCPCFGNHIHDLTGNGIALPTGDVNQLIVSNVVDTVTGRGILLSGASTAHTHGIAVLQNTVNGCGDSGLEETDIDVMVHRYGNIFRNNGDAAGEYNVERVAGTAETGGSHGYNCFYHDGGGGGANLLNLTVNSTEIITDPLFTAPDNGDFSLRPGSPCRATSFPGQFLGGNLSYLSMGAVQPQGMGAGFLLTMGVGL